RRRGLAAALVGAGALVTAISPVITPDDAGQVALVFVLPPVVLALALSVAHRRGARIACGVLALLDGVFALVIGLLASLQDAPDAIPLIPGGVLVALGGIRALARAPTRTTPPPPPGSVPAGP
ncbi:MAG TPA: hypothetical protein VID47_03535, partial [Actinomycetota bacterium]